MSSQQRMESKQRIQEAVDSINQTLRDIALSEPPKKGGIGSSDIGNVGQVTATIHPYIQITEVGTHTPEFCEATGSERGMIGLNLAAKALAMTAFDLCADKQALQGVRDEFVRWKQNRSEKGQ